MLTQDIWGIFHGRSAVSHRTLLVLLFWGWDGGGGDELNHVSLFPLNFFFPNMVLVWSQYLKNSSNLI